MNKVASVLWVACVALPFGEVHAEGRGITLSQIAALYQGGTADAAGTLLNETRLFGLGAGIRAMPARVWPPGWTTRDSGGELAVPASRGSQYASARVFENRAGNVAFDVSGRLGLAVPRAGPSVAGGERDISIRGDLFRRSENWASFGTLGWAHAESAAVNERNPWFASFGSSYQLSPRTSAGLAYDYGQNVAPGGARISELSAFVSHRLGQGLKLQGYVVRGFAGASPDWGAGAVVTYGF